MLGWVSGGGLHSMPFGGKEHTYTYDIYLEERGLLSGLRH